MDWRQVTLITAFAVLLQCDPNQGAECKNRKTVVQVKVPGNTNITVKFPFKSDPVKFVPYPGNSNADCYTCNGPQCRKCIVTDNQSPSSPIVKSPQRTNIVIDLRRDIPGAQNQPEKTDSGNKNLPSTSNNNPSPNGTPQDGTILVVQDSSSASSESNSSASVKSGNGNQAASSSSSSVVMSDRDVIASFDQSSPGDTSASNTQDIYVEDDSQSIAGSSAVSNVDPNQGSGPPSPPTPPRAVNGTSVSQPPPNVASSASKAGATAVGDGSNPGAAASQAAAEAKSN